MKKGPILLLFGAALLTGCSVANGRLWSDYKKTYPNADALFEAYPALETKVAKPKATNFQPSARLPKSSPTGSPFLKAHLKTGDVLLFPGEWSLDRERELVLGNAFHYGINRKLMGSVDSVAWKDVALFETNRPLPSNTSLRVASTTVLLVADVALGIICFTVEKACFGSCPTFYLDDDGANDVRTADAEGFSNALMPSMAYEDTDYMGVRTMKDGKLQITVKNEAMETHVIQGLRVAAVPVAEGQVALQGTDGQFYLSDHSLPLACAHGPEGDLRAALLAKDGVERHRPTDPTNLATKEELEFEFDLPTTDQPLGLTVAFRQSFVTTFLMYSAIGYLGTDYVHQLARAESADNTLNPLSFQSGIGKVLGGLEVEVWDATNSRWQYVDRFHETGPIATNTLTLPLPDLAFGDRLKIRIRAAQGSWRLDQIAVHVLSAPVTPISLEAKTDPIGDEANPTAEGGARVNQPGTQYIQGFEGEVPDGPAALFLASKGYYLEWSRQSWLGYENRSKLGRMVYAPERYLREVAPEFKAIEAAMEEVFWSTKQFNNPLNLSHEN
jgi:hypothetical protein